MTDKQKLIEAFEALPVGDHYGHILFHNNKLMVIYANFLVENFGYKDANEAVLEAHKRFGGDSDDIHSSEVLFDLITHHLYEDEE
jgi:hypothetical protein